MYNACGAISIETIQEERVGGLTGTRNANIISELTMDNELVRHWARGLYVQLCVFRRQLLLCRGIHSCEMWVPTELVR